MPRYTYKCDECEKVFETVHSMNNKVEVCPCEMSGSVTKIMSPTFIARMNRVGVGKNKVGDVVKDHIEESKRELKSEQDRLKSIEYKQ